MEVRKIRMIIFLFLIVIQTTIAQAQDQASHNNNQENYIAFTLEAGNKKIIVESCDPLFGCQKSQQQLENPVIEIRDRLFIPQEFFEVFLGGHVRQGRLRDDKYVSITFQEGTDQEEVYIFFLNKPYYAIGSWDPNTNSPKLEVKKTDRTIVVGKKGIVYISEVFFKEMGIEIKEEEDGGKVIKLPLIF
jgi:hypothetical protein